MLGPRNETRLLDTNVISYSRGVWGRSTFQAARTISPREALFVGINADGLLNAETEAVQIADLVGSEPKTGPAASSEGLQRALANKQWVHLATHGALVPDNIYASYLSTYGAQHIEVWELLKDLRASVVVLSACDTFRGTSTPGARQDFGSIGQLTLAAGARWVIATLWKVDDQIVSRLMVDFYKRNGLASADLAFALQAAQQQAASVYKDPSYYASVIAWTGDLSRCIEIYRVQQLAMIASTMPFPRSQWRQTCTGITRLNALSSNTFSRLFLPSRTICDVVGGPCYHAGVPAAT